MPLEIVRNDIKRCRIGKFLPPILHLFAVIGPSVFRLASDGVQVAPGAALGAVQFALFLLGQLFVGNVFFHMRSSFDF